MSKAKYQLEDFLAIVDNGHRGFVATIHDMLVQEGYKCKVQSTKSYGLHISYSQPKIKVVKGIIVYLLVRDGTLLIRINADHHGSYPDVLDALPKRIVNQIDKAEDCKKFIDPSKCWTGCMGYEFHIRGTQYQKCCITCFELAVEAESMPHLLALMKSESEERRAG